MDGWISAQSASPGGRHRVEKEIEMPSATSTWPTVAAGEWRAVRADRGMHRAPVAWQAGNLQPSVYR